MNLCTPQNTATTPKALDPDLRNTSLKMTRGGLTCSDVGSYTFFSVRYSIAIPVNVRMGNTSILIVLVHVSFFTLNWLEVGPGRSARDGEQARVSMGAQPASSPWILYLQSGSLPVCFPPPHLHHYSRFFPASPLPLLPSVIHFPKWCQRGSFTNADQVITYSLNY